jgi:hypothetical protein
VVVDLVRGRRAQAARGGGAVVKRP